MVCSYTFTDNNISNYITLEKRAKQGGQNYCCFVYCVHSQSPHSEQHMAVFLLSLHFKDNTMCVIEHISFNSAS